MTTGDNSRDELEPSVGRGAGASVTSPGSQRADAPAGLPDRRFLPNLFILGAAKCGTTTLYEYLAEMPEVFMTPAKEPEFFEAHYEKGLEWYHTHFFRAWAGEPVIGEARHRNLYLPYVPPRIHETNPDAKLIVLVRNPIERAFSHWLYWARNGVEMRSFEDAIKIDFQRIQKGLCVNTPEEIRSWAVALKNYGFGLYRTYLDSGYYLEQIERYLALFPRENLKVILLDDMRRNPARVIGEVVQFLGVDPARNRFTAVKHANHREPLPPWPIRAGLRAFRTLTIRLRLRKWKGYGIGPYIRKWTGRQSKMKPKSRAWLREHYRERVAALESFLDRDLSHWQ